MPVAPPVVHEALRAGGEPLEPATRESMQASFGQDFGHVRVHTGELAERSARAVAARAYTVGSHVVFGAGQYAPGTPAGERLLAHELAHVIQQGASAASVPQRSALPIGAREDPFEREADALAAAALHGPALDAPTRTGGIRVQRQDGGAGDAGVRATDAEAQQGADAGPATSDAGTGADAGAGAADAGSGAAPTEGEPAAAPCDPQPLSRAQYLAHSGTSTDDFGLTVLSGTVSVPAVATRRARGGVVLEATDAVMPAIDSVFTTAGTFTEGTSQFIASDGAECSSGRYDMRWTITRDGAAQIRAGELEHCADLQYAFAISLRRYADIVNRLAASGRVFPNRRAAIRAVTRLTGAAPDDWAAVFQCLAHKTEDRDFMQWHTPRPRTVAPRLATNCAFSEAYVHGRSFPQIGQHASADVVRDCGENGGGVPASRPRRRMRVTKPAWAGARAVSPAPAGSVLLQRQRDDAAAAPAAAWSPDLINIIVDSDREDCFGTASPGSLDRYSSCGSPVKPPFCMSARVPFQVHFFVDRENAPIAQPFTPPSLRVRMQFVTSGSRGARTLNTDVSDLSPRYVGPNRPLATSFGQDFPVGSAESGTLTMRIEMLGAAGYDVVYTDSIDYIIVPCV